MERAGLALRHGLGLGRGIHTPCFTLSPVSRSPLISQRGTATRNSNTYMRVFASMRLAHSLARTGPAMGPGQPPLVHRSTFIKSSRTTTNSNLNNRSLTRAASQSSAVPATTIPVEERSAEAEISNEGTPGASSSKAGGYPFAEIEPKWQR